MIRPMLLAAAFFFCTPVLHAQLLKKITGRNKEKTEQARDDEDAEADPFKPRKSAPIAVNPALIIGGDERVEIDSSYDYDVAVYQSRRPSKARNW
ncbi:hypothetical protein MKQ70_17055 [Chitinophaga sedimenti]|uniref:hypothetical protein n=1 Tax=Chitinophaga sedimenti TaxID=2033606 RepID=UPI00200480C6|nr:hypothetical protein [Chitinophaga sedimenti]MCK7556635.1 hypothetical protein [Chitinophaga sedimenti]